MISYKYKLYNSHKNKHLDEMLSEAAFVWNHALSLQKRYYKILGKYIGVNRMQSHFKKRIPRQLLHSDTTIEILQRLDAAYSRFFKHVSKRPPKFKKNGHFTSIVFKRTGGFSLNKNVFTVNRINKTFKFSLSRPYEGKIKRLIVKRSCSGDFYIIVVLDRKVSPIAKTRNGASVGIDFGLKKYLTLSDGTIIDNPLFLKRNFKQLQQKTRVFCKCQSNSKNKERKRLEIARLWDKVLNQRSDFQWKLAHSLCQRYDNIFIEDLNIQGMFGMWGRKMGDLAHNEFVEKLKHVADKYGVTVHKIYRYYPSSKTCTCGYINRELTLADRKWTCPHCGAVHDRDLLAANNILRQGIVELESAHKSQKRRKDSCADTFESNNLVMRVCQENKVL